MGVRGELFTTQVNLDNRSYFFNVKENRNGDVFLQIVESKIKDGEDDRRAIVVFSDDMQKFFQGMDASLQFIEKEEKERSKKRAEKKAAKDAFYGNMEGNKNKADSSTSKKIYRRKGESRLIARKKEEAERERMAGKMAEQERKNAGIKRSGNVLHITSKRSTEL